jgi:ComF family protein
MRCGKPVDSADEEYCMDCHRLEKHYEQGYPLYQYVSPVKEGLLAMKYNNRREYADFYSQDMLRVFGSKWKELKLDGILPVPIHKHKRRSRGYNQAELLADPISRQLQLPLYKKLLIRTIDTLPQKELDDKERMKNLKSAFLFHENEVKLKKVLLVDDIYTTGATIEACTEVLHQKGVSQVYYTSVCIGRGY